MRSNLPLLGAIAGFLRWLEELAVIVSGPLLTIGLGIALVDLLTDGQLLATTPWLLFAWAVSQAVGVDAQLVGSSFSMAQAIRQRHYVIACCYLVLVAALAYVAYVASQTFAMQETYGITIAQALHSLGLDSTLWILQRSALAVFLVILSGFLRYVAPKKELADEREELQRDLELEPLRMQARLQKAVGYRGLAAALVKGAAVQMPTIDASESVPGEDTEEEVTDPTIAAIRLVSPTSTQPKGRSTRRRRPPRQTPSWEKQARKAWEDGARTVEELKLAVPRMSHGAAAHWRAAFSQYEPGEEVRKEA